MDVGKGADQGRLLCATQMMERSASLSQLIVRREKWALTWTGRLLVLTSMAALAVMIGRGLCAFLAITSPVGGQFLVVEGWMPGYAYREAAAQFRKSGYQKIIAAGVFNEDPDACGDLRVHFGGEKLISFGVPKDLVVTTATEEVQQDRTFHAAMAVKHWLQEQGLRATSIDVVTIGPHARNSVSSTKVPLAMRSRWVLSPSRIGGFFVQTSVAVQRWRSCRHR